MPTVKLHWLLTGWNSKQIFSDFLKATYNNFCELNTLIFEGRHKSLKIILKKTMRTEKRQNYGFLRFWMTNTLMIPLGSNETE